MKDGKRWQRAHIDRLNDDGMKISGLANLPGVIESFPPHANRKARHRANILVKTDLLRVVLVTMLKDGELQEHSAPGPITVQVLKGAFDFTVGDESHLMEQGDLISLAPGVRHTVHGVEDGAFLLTIGDFVREPDPGGRQEVADHEKFLTESEQDA